MISGGGGVISGGGGVIAVGGGVVVAACMWTFMFRLDRTNIWPRTWVAAVAVSAYAVTAVFVLGRLRTLVGPVNGTEIGVGLVVGAGWVVATQVGVALLRRLVPGLIAQVADLYQFAEGDTVARMAGPLVAMAVAEELLFRGLIQGQAGIAAAVVIYGTVQIVERKWALVLAAVLGGLVWGGVFAWREGLVAAVVAHATWTSALTFIWPIRGTPASNRSGEGGQPSPTAESQLDPRGSLVQPD